MYCHSNPLQTTKVRGIVPKIWNDGVRPINRSLNAGRPPVKRKIKGIDPNIGIGQHFRTRQIVWRAVGNGGHDLGYCSEDEALFALPVFTSNRILLPTMKGSLRAYEPHYVKMFEKLRDVLSETQDRRAKFLHILSPSVTPPAMQDSKTTLGLPAVGTVAVIESVEEVRDGSLIVNYVGDRRARVHLVTEDSLTGVQAPDSFSEEDNDNNEHSVKRLLSAAVSWYGDRDPEVFAVGEKSGKARASLDGIERDVHAMVCLLRKLSRKVNPNESVLPESILKYAPPSGGKSQRLTSYDRLKAAGHQAASAIDMWRRHGSVYKSPGGAQVDSTIQDPYSELSERLAKPTRQEMYSFALASLLQMGIPEAGALLLSQSTEDRLVWISEACIRPYLAQLQAQAALINAVNES